MTKEEKAEIENMVWDCTVGAGVDPDECSNEPDSDFFQALKYALGRKVTGEDIACALEAWRRCLQEIRQP